MLLQVKNAKLIEKLQPISGEYNGKEWQMQDLVFSIDRNFSNETFVVITAKTDTIDIASSIKVGDELSIFVYPASRKAEGKTGKVFWNTHLYLHHFDNINEVEQVQAKPAPAPKAKPAPAVQEPAQEGDLPF